MPEDKFNFSLKDFLSDRQRINVSTEETKTKFDEKIKEIAIKERERQVKAEADSLNLPYINLAGFPIKPESLSLISENDSAKLKVICFFDDEDSINVGAIDPENSALSPFFDNLATQNRKDVKLFLISQNSFDRAFRLYDTLPKIREIVSGVEITEKDFNKYKEAIKTFKDLERAIKSVSMTDLVTLIIATAIKTRASDVHVEIEEKKVKVRFRIDGILQDVASINKEIWPKVTARVKLLAKLKINITNKPQDGRFTIFLTEEKIDVRVSILPTSYGESIVMRLLMSSAVNVSFENMGLEGDAYRRLITEIKKPNGMTVTTGPTGSGKTTSLYAMLTTLNVPGVKIITIEDPIEYRIEGINQSQIEVSRNYTFATGLRSILRQDPDVVMVGEIRDLETADIAINAALTGHAVFSTIHTNDASGTVPRFLSMGVKPFLLAPALNAMIGQRLVRRICEHCKEEDKLDKDTFNKVEMILKKIPKNSGFEASSEMKFYKSRGCPKCQGLGYWGRVGIYEVMNMNHEVEQLILTGHISEYDMLKVGVKYGMITMIQDGLLKALKGITSVEEVFRVSKNVSYFE